MKYREIIAEAWAFTQENKKLIVWYAFVPSIFATIFGVCYLIYQFYSFKSSALFENWDQSFLSIVINEVIDFAQQNLETLPPLIIGLVIFAILYFILPPIAEGAMIQLIARRRNGQAVRIRDGLRYGFLSFLPLFNYSWLARTFNLFVIAGEIGLVLKNIPSFFEPFLPIFVIYIIVSVILNFLFTFTEYYIAIDELKVTEAMTNSANLVVRHWNVALMVALLMLIIAIRIILQIIFVLLVPILIIAGIYFVASSSLPLGGVLVAGLSGFLALILASYLGAVVHVFSSSVWVFTFLDLTTTPEVSAREVH